MKIITSKGRKTRTILASRQDISDLATAVCYALSMGPQITREDIIDAETATRAGQRRAWERIHRMLLADSRRCR